MRRGIWFLGKALLVLLGITVLGGIVMTLWNAILPAVFVGVHAIDFRQALGILVLSRILFGGFRGRGGFRGGRWQRMNAMTPEERAQFRRGGWCRGDNRQDARS